ncbi:hypothetical protein CRM94_15220 [Burkholderia gladioli]|uniref:Uncharacterized protein n=1 Tax=Burkholderia gladioli TaxID=28095 RepID=A0A2A7SIN7_BURGA|nr:hypothetical protein CO712_26735 [Burkholderia gladioli pv. gladioli]PEH43388.1 hypothetical protein CRM94_15220 [Burkholderia gladioli]PEH80678.1 hypothetical protein CRM95_20835 [Burkholderia gladioli]
MLSKPSTRCCRRKASNSAPLARIACGISTRRWPESSCESPLIDMSNEKAAFRAMVEWSGMSA